MIDNNEITFLDRIDCNFPYHDREESVRLIEQAAAISTNALFSVIEELCRIPESERLSITSKVLLELLNLTASKLNHPLKAIIVDAAEKMICGQELQVDDVITKMHKVQKYPKQFAALSVLYFSCDDKEGKIESIWNDIVNEWNKV